MPLPHLRAATTLGQGLVEYALVVALVGVLAIGAIMFIGGGISNAFNTIGGQLGLPNATVTPAPTITPKATATPKPAKTPRPARTPKPTKPPKTPKP